MRTYICPMHLEVTSDKPGKCPKCGMELVIKNGEDQTSYVPLLVIVGLILSVTLILSFKDLQVGVWSLSSSISYFMAGFFLVFAGFKLIDLRGFAQGYSTYDLLAQKFPSYGYVYPFIELFFGLAMAAGYTSVPLLSFDDKLVLWLEVIVMGFSGLGVAIKLARREKFQCVCLGTAIKLPLTKVTLIEDFGMALLALLLLII